MFFMSKIIRVVRSILNSSFAFASIENRRKSEQKDCAYSVMEGTRGNTESEAIEVRAMRRDDMAVIHALIHELAKYEGVPEGPQLSVQDLIEDGFDSSPPWFFGLVAVRAGSIVGYALCNRAYSSWTRRAFYLEDLYVDPGQRRGGIGTLLLQELCKIAVNEDVHRIDWHVLESNGSALRFYSKLGASDLRRTEGRAALRLHRDRIDAVAHGQLLDA